jgi:hypothetical protein
MTLVRLRRLQELSVQRPTIPCSVVRHRFTESDEGAGTCEPMSERNVLRAMTGEAKKIARP